MGYKRSRHQVHPINNNLAWCPKLGKPIFADEARDRLEKIMSKACWADQPTENPAASAEESVKSSSQASLLLNRPVKRL